MIDASTAQETAGKDTVFNMSRNPILVGRVLLMLCLPLFSLQHELY
jgi:protein-S-isoprenylcysteine O-methyltransferase Ste14